MMMATATVHSVQCMQLNLIECKNENKIHWRHTYAKHLRFDDDVRKRNYLHKSQRNFGRILSALEVFM